MILRAQSNVASTKQIFLPFHSTTTDLIFTLLSTEPIKLMLFKLLLFLVVFPPLSLQLAMLSLSLFFLVLVSADCFLYQWSLTSSSAPQPASPLWLIFVLFRVSVHARHLIKLWVVFPLLNFTPLPSQASPRRLSLS